MICKIVLPLRRRFVSEEVVALLALTFVRSPHAFRLLISTRSLFARVATIHSLGIVSVLIPCTAMFKLRSLFSVKLVIEVTLINYDFSFVLNSFLI